MRTGQQISKHVSFILCFLIYTALTCRAQTDYFQQEVNYRIQVKLNDKEHSLSAKEELIYINNSTRELPFLYFHLWPNAYKDNSTALAKQLLRQGKTSLYWSKPEERGYIDSLDFYSEGSKLRWEYDSLHSDICKVWLPEALKPFDTVRISTPFYVKIPDARFSRLGHTGQAYFITQWYPKPAVFDQNGWHPMPYLDQGEFYSEFGSFEVDITLPKNYVLSATGDRINASEEEDWLNDNVAKTLRRMELGDYKEYDMGFPPSSPEWKTIKFRQFRVHDFAWFADKRFNVLHDQLELPNSKRIVDTWSYFTNKNFKYWKNSIDYLNESTYFYSYLLGDYPYNSVNAVDGTIMAGGGMEYPNITVIGDVSDHTELDITITHEVGHNWFYGILGSNERDHAWMDEGLNSLYEMRYVRAKYPSKKLSDYMGLDSSIRFLGAGKIPYWKEKELAYLYSARANSDQPLSITSDSFTSTNYGTIVYAKSAAIFDHLMSFMGEEVFDKAMQFYFEKFKFKHPSEADLRKTLSHHNGAELDWFFDQLIHKDSKIDYRMKNVRRRDDGSYDITVKNMKGTQIPFAVFAYKNGKITGLLWSKGFEGKRTIGFPAVDAERFIIDGVGSLPEVNRKNNMIRTHGIFRKAKAPRLKFLTALEDPKKRDLFFIPMAGGNFYNGAMAGVMLHNYGIYRKKFEFFVNPFYSFQSKTPAGFGEFHFNAFPKKWFREVNIGAGIRSYGYDIYQTKYFNQALGTDHAPLYLSYLAVSPFIRFEFKKHRANDPVDKFLTYTHYSVLTEIPDLDTSTYRTFAAEGPKKTRSEHWVNDLRFDWINRRVIHPYSFQFSWQHNDKMAKVQTEFNWHLTFSKKHDLSIRTFAGAFLFGTEEYKGRYAFRGSGFSGYHDYTFSENFIARNERNGLGFSQFSEQDGAMKVWTPLAQSTQWLVSVNIKSPRIFILPLRIYADAVCADGRSMNEEKVIWNAGANIVLWKDIIDIYIPAVYSNDISKALELNNVEMFQRIRFTLNLHKFVPRKIIKESIPF